MTDPKLTPPPELVQEWGHDANLSGVPYDDETGHWEYEQYIAARAAQWGADLVVEACCALLELSGGNARDFLQSARRLSLKEQALEVLERSCFVNQEDAITIRLALESIDD